MLRLKKSLFIFTLVMIGTLVFFGCDRRGSLNQNELPHVSITTYAGQAAQDSLDLEDPSVFQQTIRWTSNDEDGVVEGYAYRVVKEVDGVDEYITTPGHDFIQDSDGWVYHYKEGANESIPMDNDNALITIWTKDVYAVVNFPANVDGDSTNVISRFDLKCIDNSRDESSIVSKYFNVYSYQPGVSILSTSGDISGEKVGTGIILEFSILNKNPYVDVTPDHFEFQLYTKDNITGELTRQHDEEWISTRSTDNATGNIAQYALTNTDATYPQISPNNIVGTVAMDSTYIVARTVDVAGIYSKEDTISVLVSEEFYPGTVIFDGFKEDGTLDSSLSDIWVLGENHYLTYLSSSISTVIPSINTADGVHFSTPFWVNDEQNFSAINSNDLNIHVHWSWKGNYEDNNPNRKLNDEVEDELTGENYYSDIIAFDLRLDGEAFVYPPLPGATYNIVDADGKEWLRVYKALGLDIFQNAVLYSLDSGDHKFEVRAIDLQLKADPTPASFEFTLVDPIDQVDKDGILIIDDDIISGGYSPDALVDSLYDYYVSDYAGLVDVINHDDFDEDFEILNTDLHISKFSPTDLMKYKLIIYHSDNATINNPKFYSDYESLNLYLKTGGNIVYSGTNQIVGLQGVFYNEGHMILHNYFGIPNYDPDLNDVLNFPADRFWSDAATKRMQVMQYASPDNGFTTTLNILEGDEIFNSIQSPPTNWGNDGLGTLTYFNEDLLLPGTDVIYRLGCRDAGDGPLDISDAEYDFFNGKPIALRKVTGENKCYIFGAPLSYLNKEHVKSMMNQIITEVEL